MAEFSVEDFRRDYDKLGADDLQAQLPHLQRLAEKYINKVAKTPAKMQTETSTKPTAETSIEIPTKTEHWIDYVKAHGLLDSCIVRSTTEEDRYKLLKEVFILEQQWYDKKHPLKSPEMLQTTTASLKDELKSIRSECKKRFKKGSSMINGLDMCNLFSDANKNLMASFSQKVRYDTEFCTKKMLSFAKRICQVSEEIVGPPPSPYAVIALGSIARNEATPYSDLEYAFIIAPDTDKTYFHRLAIDSYFRISSLGETPLKYLYIEELHDNYRAEKGEKRWFEDRAQSGFKIDGLLPKAGNIPTGNGLPAGQSLTLTVDEMITKYRNCLQNSIASESSDMVGDLSDMLASTVLVHYSESGKKLHDEFLIKRRMVEEKIICDRPDGKEQLEKKRIKTLFEDINKYKFCSDPGELRMDMRSVEVKTDIFRYPTILAHDMKILLGLDSCETAWEIYNELHTGELKVLSRESLAQFHFILGSAIWIRTSAYLVGNTQREKLSFHPKFDLKDADEKFFVPKKLFIAMACPLIFIKQRLLDDLTQHSPIQAVKKAFTNLTVEEVDFLTQSRVHYSCIDYKGALAVIHRALGPESTNTITALHQHGLLERDVVELTLHTLFQNECNAITVELCKHLINQESASSGPSHLNMALHHGIIAQCQMREGKYGKERSSIDRAITEMVFHFDNIIPMDAAKRIIEHAKKQEMPGLIEMGTLLATVGEQVREDAFKKIKTGLLEGYWSFDIMLVTDSIRLHHAIYEETLKAFNFLQSVYGYFITKVSAEDNNSLHHADCLICMGIWFLHFDRHEEAEEKLKAAAKIYKKNYGNSAASVELSVIKLHLGYMAFRQGDFVAAIGLCKESYDLLLVCEQVLPAHFQMNHQVQAEILTENKRYLEAHTHVVKCHEITKTSARCPLLSRALIRITEANLMFQEAKFSDWRRDKKLESYQKAKQLLVNAKDILHEIVNHPTHRESHPDIDMANKILGEIHLDCGELIEADRFLQMAMDGFIIAYDGNNQPQMALADTIFLLGEVRFNQADLKAACDKYRQAINMMGELERSFGTNNSLPKTIEYRVKLDMAYRKRQQDDEMD